MCYSVFFGNIKNSDGLTGLLTETVTKSSWLQNYVRAYFNLKSIWPSVRNLVFSCFKKSENENADIVGLDCFQIPFLRNACRLLVSEGIIATEISAKSVKTLWMFFWPSWKRHWLTEIFIQLITSLNIKITLDAHLAQLICSFWTKLVPVKHNFVYIINLHHKACLR